MGASTLTEMWVNSAISPTVNVPLMIGYMCCNVQHRFFVRPEALVGNMYFKNMLQRKTTLPELTYGNSILQQLLVEDSAFTKGL